MLQLSDRDDAMLRGDFGDGVARAMRIVARTAQVMSAPHLIDITSAHIDGCLYHGQTSLDFVEYFVDTGAKVAVPTTAPNTSRATLPLICEATASVRLALKSGINPAGSLALLVALLQLMRLVPARPVARVALLMSTEPLARKVSPSTPTRRAPAKPTSRPV